MPACPEFFFTCMLCEPKVTDSLMDFCVLASSYTTLLGHLPITHTHARTHAGSQMLHRVSSPRPWATHMERYKVMGGARRGELPPTWPAKAAWPELVELMSLLLRTEASARPSAAAVVARCELLRGKRVLVPPSLEAAAGTGGADGSVRTVVLRIEAAMRSQLLNECTECIEAAWRGCSITQCGRRTQGEVAVLEFVVEGPRKQLKKAAVGAAAAAAAAADKDAAAGEAGEAGADTDGEDGDAGGQDHVERILDQCRCLAGVHIARQM